MRIVLTSFTSKDSPGGVPRWVRHFMSDIPSVHYSWDDVVREHGDSSLPEWEKAKILNGWLTSTGKIRPDDVIIVDGFWGLALEDHKNVVSVAHGNWSHTTKDDVDAGMQPEFPMHQAVQLDYRRRHLARGGRIVAVSEFIAHQCKLQWGMEMPVIENGIELDVYVPTRKLPRKRPLVVHGVTTKNKGIDHVEAMVEMLDADVMLLDDVAREMNLKKPAALAQADVIVVPSYHEGNSYFVVEGLSCDVPIVCYDVGLMWTAKRSSANIGWIVDRRDRNPERFARIVKEVLEMEDKRFEPREWVSQFSVERFIERWKGYLQQEFSIDA